MKKACLIFGLLILFSCSPVFAMKVIVNNDTDRTVPSRSTQFENEFFEKNEVSQQQEESKQKINNEEINVNYKRQAYTFENYYKPMLGQDFRVELLGIRWNYPAYNVEQPEPPQKSEEQIQQNNDNDMNAEAYISPKLYHREAADYYIIDTIKNPDKAVHNLNIE